MKVIIVFAARQNTLKCPYIAKDKEVTTFK